MYDAYLVVELTAECQRKEAEVKSLKQELEETGIALEDMTKERDRAVATLDSWRQFAREAIKRLT